MIRCLGNLVKNAIEASGDGDEIKVFIEEEETKIIINVWNKQVMPRTTQLQIFNRSFSTKREKGRGLGTYGAKLLVEQYLNGKVYFNSNEENKTTFSIKLPK